MRRPAKTYVTRRVCASSQKTDGTESRSALPWYERGGAKIVHLLGSSHKTKERPPFDFVKSSCAAWRAHFRLLKNSNSSFFSLCSYLRFFVSLFVCLTSLELMGSWVCAAQLYGADENFHCLCSLLFSLSLFLFYVFISSKLD